MQCDICFRTGGQKLPFLCPTDARNQLYESRLEQARILLEKDALDREITAITSDNLSSVSASVSSDTNALKASSRWKVDRNSAEQTVIVDRTRQIIAHADELREKLEAARAEIQRRKVRNANRRSDQATARNGLEARRKREVDEVEQKTKIVKYRWDQLHSMTAQSRAFLCGEAAKLYGLQHHRNLDTGLDEYRIARTKIIDLRFMNSASPAQITTSFSHIAHLLILTTHYLAIRLPAEITLPHRDYPLPTILSLPSSYTYSNVPFPGSTPSHSSSNSPTASRQEASNLPRPRPLFVSKPLPLLAKEDPNTYSRFIEGATLLAYNVAWVCKSQGIPVGTTSTSFEDICALGKNLFNLLIGMKPRPSPSSRVPSAQATPQKAKPKPEEQQQQRETDSNGTPKSGKTTADAEVTIGHFSHGTAHTSLNSPSGNDFIRTFKLLSPLKLADQLKAQLLAEVASAEWELIEEDAWAEDHDDDVDAEDDGVMVGARRGDAGSLGGTLRGVLRGGWDAAGGGGGIAQSFMSMRTVIDAVELVGGGGGGGGERKPGTSGWTKLKPRG